MKYDKLPKFAKFMFVALAATELRKEETPISDSVHKTGNVNMNFKINDIPIDPLFFFVRLEQAFDHCVEKKAHELITEKLSTLESVYEDYCNLRKEIEKEVCKKLNIQIEEW